MSVEQCDIVVIGAGFSGMYALHRLRNRYKVICFEAGDGVGGTWYWNRYPGARVDVESVQYSYGFDEDLQQDWKWPEYFSAQPDLERYANHVADRFHLREHIRLSNRIEAMRFDEAENRWHVHSAKGDHVACRYVIVATGSLSASYTPDWPGRDEYKGRILHSAHWPREGVDFNGKRVGLIGTGSTGIQIAPVVAEQCEHLTVFQRTPAYSMPSGNRPMDPEYEREWKDNYPERRAKMLDMWAASIAEPMTLESIHDVTPEERDRILEEAWHSRNANQLLLSFPDVFKEKSANDIVCEFIRNKIRQIVKEPETAEKLCPTTYPYGAKRPIIDNGYFEMFNRDNVSLVDVKDKPITGFTPNGLRTADATYDLDIIIFATGFDALTGALSRIDVSGVGGRKLNDKWRGGPSNYLGVVTAGFPNLFMVHGPLSPSVLAQMITSGEWQVRWIANLIDGMERDGCSRIDTTEDAEQWWDAEVERASHETLHRLTDSWYNGSNVEGKVKKFMVYVGGFPTYTKLCTDAVDEGYRGFVRN